MALDKDSLRAYLSDRMGVESDVDDDTPLFSSSILDSFSMVDLIMFVEQEANIRVEPTDVTLDNFDSIARIVDFAMSRSA